jgi:hypothetical protein
MTIKQDESSASVYESVITCPRCGRSAMEIMPSNACRVFYQCRGCGAELRPRPGDCCVFCSYGSVPCPPRQPDRSPAR